jgi:hypothetical protein
VSWILDGRQTIIRRETAIEKHRDKWGVRSRKREVVVLRECSTLAYLSLGRRMDTVGSQHVDFYGLATSIEAQIADATRFCRTHKIDECGIAAVTVVVEVRDHLIFADAVKHALRTGERFPWVGNNEDDYIRPAKTVAQFRVWHSARGWLILPHVIVEWAKRLKTASIDGH